MREVRDEVERRRAAGKYPPALDDVPPFDDLALEDELVASVHRLESLSHIPGVTPVIHEMASGPVGPPDGFARPRNRRAQVMNQALVRGRAVARKVIGPRLEGIIRHGADYLMASARHSRIVTGRILELERRVRELEDAKPKPRTRQAKQA